MISRDPGGFLHDRHVPSSEYGAAAWWLQHQSRRRGGSAPSVVYVVEFCIEEYSSKIWWALGAETTFQLWIFNFFFSNIGCSHPISCLLFSLQSKLTPCFFICPLSAPSYPVSSSNAILPFSYTFYTPARPSPLLGCLGPDKDQEMPSLLLGLMPMSLVFWKVPSELPRPQLEHTQHKPVSPGKLAVKS